MRTTITIAVALTIGLLANAACAEDKKEEKKEGWSGDINFGWAAVRGNTQSSTTNFKGELDYDHDRWHADVVGRAIGASQGGNTTSEAYYLAGKGKYDLNDAWYTFGLVEYNKDRFSGYDKQIFETLGLGWHVFKNPVHELNLEAGIGAAQSDTHEVLDPLSGAVLVPGESRTELIGRVALEYLWHISDHATFSQNLSGLIGGDNTYVQSATELKAGIVGNLALVLSYLVKYNTQVPAGTQKTDSFSTVSLGYKF